MIVPKPWDTEKKCCPETPIAEPHNDVDVSLPGTIQEGAVAVVPEARVQTSEG